MAERKSGPVKPPVIDLTAKPATRSRSADKPAPAAEPAAADTAVPDAGPAETVTPDAGAERASDASRPPPPPRPPARLAMPWSAISIAAVAGAILGTVLTYLAVNFIALPDNRPAVADPAPRLEAQDQAIAELASRLSAAEQAASATRTDAEQATAALTAELDTLRQQLAAMPVPETVDLGPLEQQVAGLEDRIAAISAGASGEDATALARTISGLEAGISETRTALDALTRRLATSEQDVAGLRDEVEATSSAVTAQNLGAGGDIGPAVRLPLLVSGLESAVANGRPYAAELTGLTTLLPDLAVPEPIRAAAPTGLPRPDIVAARFTELVPEILAGRAAESSGDLGQDAIDWAKGLLAMRPVEETDGATPEAIVSRLEAAVARRDFAAAATLLEQLPAPMQAGAGSIADDIRTLAATDGFVAGLRAQALPETPEATP